MRIIIQIQSLNFTLSIVNLEKIFGTVNIRPSPICKLVPITYIHFSAGQDFDAFSKNITFFAFLSLDKRFEFIFEPINLLKIVVKCT
jgi:hypothetical protein